MAVEKGLCLNEKVITDMNMRCAFYSIKGKFVEMNFYDTPYDFI